MREAQQDGELRRLLLLYSQGFMVQVSQATVCNRLHSAERRLARWLLIVADRVGRQEFPLTHEFMAQMLGVRRATVTDTAGAPAARQPDPLPAGSDYDPRSNRPRTGCV